MSVEPQESSSAMPLGRRLALVVGVNGQAAPGRAALQCAADDGREIAQVLQQAACGFTLFCPPLLNEHATNAAVKDAALDLAENLQEEDFALFFFSGHAEALATEADLDDVYLVTHDFNANRIKRDRNAYLSLRWLRQILFEHDKAKQILLILDCCYAGKFCDSAPDLYIEELQQRLRSYFAEPGAHSPVRSGGIRLTLTATGDTSAKEQNGHGLLTGAILTAFREKEARAVNKQGEVTFTSLCSFLEDAMPQEQRLCFFGAGSGLVLATYPETSFQKRREHEHKEQEELRARRLRSLFSDHGGFLQDRLASFVGRETELADVRQHIQQLLATGGYVTITGQAGQGKSSLIAKLVEATAWDQGGHDRVAFHFIPLTPPPDYQVALLRNIMARLVHKYQLSDLYLASDSRAALGEGFPRILKEIREQGRQEIIFIDGLDQLQTDQQTGLRDLSFLPQGPGNPPRGIVFVLGTRPDDTLQPLEVLKPLHEYTLPSLSRADFGRVLLHRGVTLEHTLINRFYEVLDRNALYLDLVAKECAASPEMTNQEVEEVVQSITDNPENLFSLTIRRLVQPDNLWSAVIKPLLGLLLVTREPLKRDHLKRLLNLAAVTHVDGDQINRGLTRLGALVVVDDHDRYSLFHSKFRDYLLQDREHVKRKCVFDYEDEQHWHKRFVDWCEYNDPGQTWQDTSEPIEQGRRQYTRRHYIAHLFAAHLWERLFMVLDEGAYGRAKVQADPGMRSYALDLDIGRKAAASPDWSTEEAIRYLPALWRYTLLRCSLASRADMYPESAFRLMLALGEETKALGLAELLTDTGYRARIFILIASHLIKQAGREREAMQMFVRVEQAAFSLPDQYDQAIALGKLGQALTLAGQWQEAERIFLSVSAEYEECKAPAIMDLSLALARESRWK